MRIMYKKLNVIFAGSSEYSYYHLNLLIKLRNLCKVVGVLTNDLNMQVNRNKEIFSKIHTVSKKEKIPLLELKDFNFLNMKLWIESKNPNIMIVVSCGFFFPDAILDIFPNGCFNLHPSLLPKWRGASPIQHSILNGDKETGVTIFKINNKLDSGDIVFKTKHKILNIDTYATLYKKLLQISLISLEKLLNLLLFDEIKLERQNSVLATYCNKLKKIDGLINWNISAENIERAIRAFNPWPSSYFSIKNIFIKVISSEVISSSVDSFPGTILNFDKYGIQISTLKDILNITKIQFPCRKVISSNDVFCSYRDFFLIGMKIS